MRWRAPTQWWLGSPTPATHSQRQAHAALVRSQLEASCEARPRALAGVPTLQAAAVVAELIASIELPVLRTPSYDTGQVVGRTTRPRALVVAPDAARAAVLFDAIRAALDGGRGIVRPGDVSLGLRDPLASCSVCTPAGLADMACLLVTRATLCAYSVALVLVDGAECYAGDELELLGALKAGHVLGLTEALWPAEAVSRGPWDALVHGDATPASSSPCGELSHHMQRRLSPSTGQHRRGRAA